EAAGKGYLYAFWHGRQVLLTYLHQGDRICPLISRSADGDIIAQVCRSFGLSPIRGSTSRGASEALREIRKQIQNGNRVAITPDGPRGPFHEVQLGALFAAQQEGVPIVPVACGARRKWIFRGWDEFQIPSPFNRITMVYGEPMYVAAGDDLEERAAQLKRSLDAVSQEADRAAEGSGRA
ncbi:MAG TPA: lysophospholipid acyltransferase family protein, partial [Elusimicrobiota bacterium]|nr:lysophospholipid acyltransferase family protein [Elusimicrobiota bacterium]